jgi:predicted signal transduction protein with EAL and GGDEF domain
VGAGAQIAAHVMAAAHMTAAPLWVTVLVSCVPVLTLGLAIGLHSMVRRDTRITT